MKTAISILATVVIIITVPVWVTVGYVKLGLKVLKHLEDGFNGTTD